MLAVEGETVTVDGRRYLVKKRSDFVTQSQNYNGNNSPGSLNLRTANNVHGVPTDIDFSPGGASNTV